MENKNPCTYFPVQLSIKKRQSMGSLLNNPAAIKNCDFITKLAGR